jgi:hypothetical protein
MDVEQVTAVVLANVSSQFQNSIDNLQARIHQLEQEILRLRAASASTTPLPPTISRPRARLPDPVKFDGKQHRFRVWLPEIKAKLRVDDESIGDATAKFFYVYGCLDPTVQAMVLPQLAIAEQQQSWDYNTILGQLSRVYNNPNEVFEAEEALHAVKQGDQPLPAYIAKFERLLFEAKGQDWPDANKIITFRSGLSSSLRKSLSTQLALPTDYPGYLSVVQQLNRRLFTSPSGFAAAGHAPHATYAPDKMDLSTVNISSVNARARSTSPNQRETLRKQGKCVRCGSNRHWVSSCSVQPFAAATAATATAATATALSPSPPPRPYELETDDEDTDDEGHTDSEEELWRDRPLSP